MQRTAEIEGPYRYTLMRKWGDAPPALGGKARLDHIITRPEDSLAFLMLNPSTADAQVDDATVSRCIDRAARLGYGSMVVVNLFALRATDPKALYVHAEPIGPLNDLAIQAACRPADLVVAAWGAHGAHLRRAEQVLADLRLHGLADKLRCLGLTKDGHPVHPLYQPRLAELLPFGAVSA